MLEFPHIFAPITLEEMDSIKLMNRIDSKYLTDETTLVRVLGDAAKAGYRALETEGTQISPYNSIYFDTPGLKTFLDHHNRRLKRQKVRTRVYLNSGAAFLEIKRKNNKGRTKKKRMSIPLEEMDDFSRDKEAIAFLAEYSEFTIDRLSPVLSTAFDRITLVNPAKTERLTIDTHLVFNNFRTGKKTSLLDAVIIELKQDGRAASQMKGILLDNRVKPLRVSKYCIAVTLTDPSVKSGRFKIKVRVIEKTINKKIQVI
ncbi:MAG: polyphosphate polymerase domain-containing protein [Bacteroidales bacterium]|nr:polyphosphate polymerase domain-containing protein [Bacteroidales bacterium]